MNLGGANLSFSFSAKWTDIEQAFTQALGHDCDIKRFTTFLDIHWTQFHGKPFEQTINDVDAAVDSSLGTNGAMFYDDKGIPQCPATYRRIHKLSIIFKIAAHLPAELKQIKNHIMNAATILMKHPQTSVLDWIPILVTELKKKDILNEFTSINIPF